MGSKVVSDEMKKATMNSSDGMIGRIQSVLAIRGHQQVTEINRLEFKEVLALDVALDEYLDWEMKLHRMKPA